MKAAQHAGADHLGAVDELERGGDAQEAIRQAITVALAGMSLEEQGDELPGSST